MNHVTHVQFWPRNGETPASVDIERRHRDRSYDRVTRASARRLAAVCRFQLLTGEFRASIYTNGWGVIRNQSASAPAGAIP